LQRGTPQPSSEAPLDENAEAAIRQHFKEDEIILRRAIPEADKKNNSFTVYPFYRADDMNLFAMRSESGGKILIIALTDAQLEESRLTVRQIATISGLVDKNRTRPFKETVPLGRRPESAKERVRNNFPIYPASSGRATALLLAYVVLLHRTSEIAPLVPSGYVSHPARLV